MEFPLQDTQISLGEFLRREADAILAQWQELVRQAPRQVPSAQKLDRPTLRDHVPDLLARIAELADEIGRGHAPELPLDMAERHALDRLAEGFDLTEVVLEYSMLRECILRRWGTRIGQPQIESGISVLNRAIDRAIAASADSYSHARDRTLYALDRISAAALEAQGLDDLLHRLLHALVETTAAVDSAVIYLHEAPQRLRPRASAGVGRGVLSGRELRFGQGLAGHVAQVKRPVLKSAAKGPLEAETLTPPGTRAVYCVPLLEGQELIGVAQIGSHSAWDFSEQDKLLFFAMANRATSAIVQQLLKEAIEKRARELAAEVDRRRALEAVVSTHPDFMYLLDVRQRLTWANPSLLRLWGRSLEDCVGKTFAELGYPEHLVKKHKAELDRALAGETVRGENEYTSPSGQTGFFEYVFAPVRDSEGVVRAIAGTTRDITHRAGPGPRP